MKAPFPWFGGKSRAAPLIWERFGNVPNYVEPFAGSLAVLLQRPGGPGRNETVNDKDAWVANFWRALAADPDQVAFYADWPVQEVDLHARHQWLVKQSEFQERLLSDPEYYDARIAGWWVWGLSLWIGGGWCARPDWQGRQACEGAPKGIHALEQKRPQIKKGGTGVHRAAYARQPWRQRPCLKGQGVTRQLPAISGQDGASGRGVHAQYASDLEEYLGALSQRLRRVRVCCGDWQRILGPSPTTEIGITGVLLDPPYGVEDRDAVYNVDSRDLSRDVFAWALEKGENPKLRIAVCGYEGEYYFPRSWTCVAWKANGGYANQGQETRGRVNAKRERIWFSPHCLQPGLFPLWEEWDGDRC
ncbi:MAG: DNA adenine methylase [Acidobacteriaceae bacterium]|nr:DNA adenine methylase [Acidobacteriaceae bacterium]